MHLSHQRLLNHVEFVEEKIREKKTNWIIEMLNHIEQPITPKPGNKNDGFPTEIIFLFLFI